MPGIYCMVLSPQQTINHTPPPSQHVQHLQPTHTPLPIEVGTLQTTSTPQGSQYRYNLHPEVRPDDVRYRHRRSLPASFLSPSLSARACACRSEERSKGHHRVGATQFAPAGTAPSRSKLSLFLFLFAKHPRYAVTAGAYRHSYFLPSG